MDFSLKVRVGEYDAGDFDEKVEETNYQEYDVSRMRIHPDFSLATVVNNLAVLEIAKPIDLVTNKTVNAACFPACSGMFDFKFENGTGTR